MTEPTVVLIDPDGTAPEWMYVVIDRETGVFYEHQYGGTANRQARIRGYLVPVHSADARYAFDQLFVRELKGTGLWGGETAITDDIVRRLTDIISKIPYWTSDPLTERTFLILDIGRRKEIDEAHLPVKTRDGNGILIWPNSD